MSEYRGAAWKRWKQSRSHKGGESSVKVKGLKMWLKELLLMKLIKNLSENKYLVHRFKILYK